MNPRKLPPHAQLMKFIVGKWISKPVYAAAALGIADMLAEGPKSIGELAAESGTHPASLYRMMRALASVGIFSETEDRHFELTPMAECLKTGAMRSTVLLFNSDWSDRAWGCFMDSVRTGGAAFEKAHGMPLSNWLEENPQAAEVFNQANAVKAAGSHRAIVDSYDFTGVGTLTDVGGGLGALTVEILASNPMMKATVADTSSVIQVAKKIIMERGMEDRCQAVQCDFFKAIPPGSDAYLLSNTLHDWPDDKCGIILKNVRRAMRKESRLLVIEMIVPPGNEPSIAKLLDLEMLVMTGGRERTEAEFHRLLESSGFTISRIIPTEENIFIIEGATT